MYAKASSYLCYRDQLTHEFRFFSFQLGKLIDDDQQMRNRFGCLTIFDKFRIFINVFYTIFSENTLTPAVLTLDGYHGSANPVSGKVGDLSDRMWQIGKQIRHTATLKVNDQKADIQWAEIYGK